MMALGRSLQRRCRRASSDRVGRHATTARHDEGCVGLLEALVVVVVTSDDEIDVVRREHW